MASPLSVRESIDTKIDKYDGLNGIQTSPGFTPTPVPMDIAIADRPSSRLSIPTTSRNSRSPL